MDELRVFLARTLCTVRGEDPNEIEYEMSRCGTLDEDGNFVNDVTETARWERYVPEAHTLLIALERAGLAVVPKSADGIDMKVSIKTGLPPDTVATVHQQVIAMAPAMIGLHLSIEQAGAERSGTR